MPCSLVSLAIIWAHGQDHCSSGVVESNFRQFGCHHLWQLRLPGHCMNVQCVQGILKAFLAPLAHIPLPDSPNRHLMIDYVDMTQRLGRITCILVLICKSSTGIVATPAQDQRSVATFFCRDVFPRFGLPHTISSDNGPQFIGDVIKTTMKM